MIRLEAIRMMIFWLSIYVKTTKYTVKARDNKTNREQFRNAEIFKVALKGGGYSSKDYYEGYLPWNDDIAAYQWFLDFWNYPYTGEEVIINYE